MTIRVAESELLNSGNNNQPAPVLSDAKTALNEMEVDGSLAVAAGTSYLVQYFGNNPASDQGQTLLGSQMISAQSSAGTVPLTFVTTATLPAGATVTAIASVAMAPSGSLNPATGDTSRFSNAVSVAAVDPFIVTNTTDSATNPQIGSLRFAILSANADVGNSPTISFHIGTGLQTITLNADLPAITNPVTIDGYTEPGASPNTAAVGTNAVIMVQIFVPNGGVSDAALVFDAGSHGSVVQGLSIIGADNGTDGGDAGIDLDVSDVTVVGNFIGVQANGKTAGPNREGIIVENSTGDVIGGPARADRNLISGNTDSGILVGTATGAVDNLLVQGNLIGTDKTGLVGIPNLNGIDMIGASTSNNTIGGTTAGAGNTIADNTAFGVVVDAGTGNAVLSNSIHDNTGGGIELLNGGNNDQPAPVLTFAEQTASNELEVVGSLAVDAGTSYLVQYFSNNPASDQGQTLLGSQTISAQSSAGTVPLNFVTTATLPAGATVTAIASVKIAPMGSLNPATGDTSRFSNAVALVAVNPFIVTNTTDAPTNPQIGSLRFAILAANADVANTPTISFDIGTGIQTITLNADLPAITNPVTIDGYTEPGASPNTAAVGSNAVIMVQIFVPNGGVSDAALVFDAGSQGSVVRGLSIIGADNGTNGGDAGIDLDASDVTVLGNFIGVQANGETARPNREGIIVENGTGDVIGGPAPADRNLISGNTDSGISVVTDTSAADNLLVQGNLIGTNSSGNVLAASPQLTGIRVTGSNITIGGTTAATRNVISGNADQGINIAGSMNLIEGNYVGTNAAGTAAVPDGDGVDITGSGNGIQGNLISGNKANGVAIFGAQASGNQVFGNTIGLDLSGVTAIPNQDNGVVVSDAGRNTIGGLTSPFRNVISGNAQDGVLLFSTTGTGGSVVVGNLIGTTGAGSGAAPNRGAGVLIDGSGMNTIGGLTSTPGTGPGNVISGNAQAGMLIYSPGATAPAVSNSILGNLIGTDITGMQPLGNLGGGVLVTNSGGNIIGGAAAGARNIISANAVAGIEISGQLSSNNQVAGNYIGTNIDGSDRPGSPDIPTPQPNQPPSQPTGVLLVGVSGNTVGGASFTDPSSNLISGNAFGIQILGNPSAQTQSAPAIGSNAILGNKIGTDSTGMLAVPNFEIGVFVQNSASNAISGNLISCNAVAGIDIFGVGSSNNSVSSNVIGGNANGQASFRRTSSTTSFTSPVSGTSVLYGVQAQGIVVIGSSNNQIGSTGGNQIVGNLKTGVYIVNRDSAGFSYPTPTNNKVQNNSIRSNQVYGVFLYNAPSNQISTSGATRNRFSGNPVTIRRLNTAVVVPQRRQSPPKSTRVPKDPSLKDASRHPKIREHPVVSHRPRVPKLFP